MIRKVLFIIPPYVVTRKGKGIQFKVRSFPAFPYGVLSLSTYITRNTDYCVPEIFDCNTVLDWEEKLKEKIRTFNPDAYGVSVMFDISFSYLDTVMECIPEGKIVTAGGMAATASYKKILDENPKVDAVCYYEGEAPFLDFVRTGQFGKGWITRASLSNGIPPEKNLIQNLDDVVDIDYSFVDIDNYPMQEIFSPHALQGKQKRFFLITSRGCPFSCLSGDTIIDTTNGKMPIGRLVGTTPRVLTRDPVTNEIVYAQTSAVVQTGMNRKLLRVNFKEGGHIDCTPDHKFIVFKNGNQCCDTREFETEAQNLKPGNSVRAVHYEYNIGSYVQIVWGRRFSAPQHRLVMESIIGRKLLDDERVHHKDRNTLNNVESNLILTTKHDHVVYHPEVSERMKNSNPIHNMSKEKLDALRLKNKQANTGKTRTLESRINYRLSKLGRKNPNWVGGNPRSSKTSRIKEINDGLEINHVVESVESLNGLHDTYCMEVPGYNWFYANDVLVHNCRFCMHSADPDKSMRYASIEKVIAHVRYLKEELGMTVLIIYDDQILLNKKRAKELFRELAKFKINRIECPNGLSVAFMDEEIIQLMKEAGMDSAQLAIESGSEYVLRELIHKPLHLNQVKPVIDLCRKHGLWTTGYFVVGMPGETDEMRFETLKFIMECGLDWATFNLAVCTHGSELYRECIEKGYIHDKNMLENWSVYSIVTPEYTPEHITEMSYSMNLFANFLHNHSMERGEYDLAIKAFMSVISTFPDHAYAYKGIVNAATARFNEIMSPAWRHYESIMAEWEDSLCKVKI